MSENSNHEVIVAEQSKAPEQSLRVETYKQSCEDHRFFGDMRFKQLSLFAVINGFLLNAIKTPTPKQMLPTVSLIGMVVTSVLWIMEVRSSIHGHAARAYIKFVEGQALKLNGTEKGEISKEKSTEDAPQWEQFEAQWTHFNATNAVLCLYFATFSFWLGAYLKNSCGVVRLICGGMSILVVAILIAFTAREYRKLYLHGRDHWKW